MGYEYDKRRDTWFSKRSGTAIRIRVPLRSAGAYPAVSSIASINYQVLDIKLRNKSLRINT